LIGLQINKKKTIEGTKFKIKYQGPRLHTNDIKETRSVVQPKTKYARLLRERPTANYAVQVKG